MRTLVIKPPSRPSLAVVILTLDEEKHIARCIQTARQVADQIFVVDSFSTDRTCEIARELGAEVYQHPFTHQAAQLAWALDALTITTDWIMRIDADEVISVELAGEINNAITAAAPDIGGFTVARYVRFQDTLVRHGGFPQPVLRLWRTGNAEVEQRWMDEHVLIQRGRIGHLKAPFIDDNLNDLSWWIEKHNRYATREAIEILRHQHRVASGPPSSARLEWHARAKRWIKMHVYNRLPIGVRPVLYFHYRMLVRLGILDGLGGLQFHALQSLWYRLLVDLKVKELERRMAAEALDLDEAVRRQCGINLSG